MMNRISYYLGNRLFEWAMSIPIVMLSLMLFIWPQITRRRRSGCSPGLPAN
jgi:uncharacterized RDD family membrane protein YckC